MTDDPSHPLYPVTCVGCGQIIGRELESGLLRTPLGDVIELHMIHCCGRLVHWDKHGRQIERTYAHWRQVADELTQA